MSLSPWNLQFRSSYKKLLLKPTPNINKTNISNSQSTELIKDSSIQNSPSKQKTKQRNKSIFPKLTKSHSIMFPFQQKPKLNSSSNVLVVKLNLSNLNLIKPNPNLNSTINNSKMNIKQKINPVRLNKKLALQIFDLSKIVKCVQNNYIRNSLIVNSNCKNLFHH